MDCICIVTLIGIYKVFIKSVNEFIKRVFRFYVVTEEAMKLTTSTNKLAPQCLVGRLNRSIINQNFYYIFTILIF